jgi:protein gp37
MGELSSIEWTEATWNPVTGCTKISAGCAHCYAERMSMRLKAMHQPRYSKGFEVATHKDALILPLTWKRPTKIFVNSMSDLFHEAVPDEFIFDIFEVMRQATWHDFQILTKRPDRLIDMNNRLPWAPNIWMGVTVESGRYISRIDKLRQTDAAIKFLSIEPLIAPMPSLDINGIDWVIVGGESGPNARPMLPEWVISVRNDCQSQNVPFFFKQWGGTRKKKNGRMLDGAYWNEFPRSSTAELLSV